ncbi:MAG: phosphoribosylamine--glycine ligase [Prochloraceae cyanobacterium]|nr:phosphoribosylamine--glycine ligase [Prochloraceae cyanobacterium]
MKILVVGNGGREHALAWKLLQSPHVDKVFCTPGNGGTATMSGCENLSLSVEDFAGIANTVKENDISLVVVGPELPLSLGITDYLQEQNIAVFGPTKAGALIESSKTWAKELMVEAEVPTAIAKTFTDSAAAKEYILEVGAPIVVKADALAAGKGVIVATTVSEATSAIDALFSQGFDKVLVEEFLEGEEVSVLALCDGTDVRSLWPAQDNKRVGEGDTGKNTGGMGAICPAPIATAEIMAKVNSDILEPVVKTLQKKGINYCGVLYAGLMITKAGEAKVLEFNCRFGDPETQAVLPLLETPLEELLLACTQKTLGKQPALKWRSQSAVCVVAASGGYPDSYQKGYPISGIEKAEKDAIVFHAGTVLKDNQILTSGGRVLGVTGIGDDFNSAIESAYQGIDKIEFEKIYYRKDIGHKTNKA